MDSLVRKDQIRALVDELEVATSRVDIIETTIKDLQELCTHQFNGEFQMELVGNDSHKDHYKCTICGKEDWV